VEVTVAVLLVKSQVRHLGLWQGKVPLDAWSFLSLGRTGTVNKDVSKIIILPIDSQRCGVKDMTSGGVFSPDTENFQKDFLDFLVLGMSARGTFSDRSILCAQSPLPQNQVVHL